MTAVRLSLHCVGRGLSRPVGGLAIAVALSGASAAPALAANAGVETQVFPDFPVTEQFTYQADPGEANDVAISLDANGVYTIEDRGATIHAGRSCQSLDPHRVVCRSIMNRPGSLEGNIFLGEQNDRLSMTAAPPSHGRRVYAIPQLVFGGPGDDTITLNATRTQHARGGSDFTRRGLFLGTYAVQGDAGNDLIYGSPDDDIIEGGPGQDVLYGGAGNDVVAGGRDDDVLSGGPGNDFVLGSDLDAFNFGIRQPPDADVLLGDAGIDLLAGGPGGDRLSGGSGRDTLLYARALGIGPRPPVHVSVSFDGRPNDGPAGEGDNALRPDLESVISVGSGNFSVADTVALKGSAYALAGGRSTNASIIVLSRLGTPGAQSATFYGSSFTVRPERRLTEVNLTGANRRICRQQPRIATALGSISRRSLSRLWGSAKGRFRTRGRYGAATVRGTVWLTAERCDGTLVAVAQGAVSVRDFRRRHTVLVPAGRSYLAEAPK
jgi:Ca2+-binding RTX toxin-like protein